MQYATNYFRNVELTRLYPISERAVRGWVESARKGRLDLELIEHNDKFFIANTAKNQRTIQAIVEDRKKYYNSRAHKQVSPVPGFYTIFEPEQILDIISNLVVHREIPRQYNYFADGARRWDDQVKRQLDEEDMNPYKQVMKLLSEGVHYLDGMLAGYKRVNLIDLGAGNGVPARIVLDYLLKKKLLGRYIAVDLSPAMLTIAQQNILEWFGGKVGFEADIRDFTHERFSDQLVREAFSKNRHETINLVMMVGATLSNLRVPGDALRTVHNSIDSRDIFISDHLLDNMYTRHYFGFTTERQEPGLSLRHRYILDLLNIDESLYDVEAGFDPIKKERFVRVRLKYSISVKFEYMDGERVVDFHKNDTILVARYRQQNLMDTLGEFEQNGFGLRHAIINDTGGQLLSVHNVRLEPDE